MSDHCRCGGDMPGRCPGPAFCPMEQPSPPMCERCERDDNDAEDRGTGVMLCADCADDVAQDQAERRANPDHNADLRDILAARLKETRP